MTKKDYIILAGRIADMEILGELDSFAIDKLCEVLKKDNFNFDKEKFLSFIDKRNGKRTIWRAA